MTIHLDGAATLYLDFWTRGFLVRKREPSIDLAALDSLTRDYFLKTAPASPALLPMAFTYSARYSNAGLPNFCLTMLQLGIACEICLVVEKGRASFVFDAAREVAHIAEKYFLDVESISKRRYEAVRAGSRYRPHHLSTFSLPKAPGIDDAAPLPIPFPSLAEGGQMNLGNALSPLSGLPVCPLLVTTAELNRGTLVVGATGSGKTNTVMRLTEQVRDKASVLVFDVKGEYRSLHKTMNATVYGFREKNLLSMNLLKAEGPPSEWVKQFSSIFAEVISKNIPASGSKDVIAEELDRLYKERGVYDGSEDWPHIGDLLEALDARSQKTKSDREKNWLASALRVMRTISIGRTRDAFQVRQGLSTRHFLNGVIVIDLDGLGDADGVGLVMSVILQKIRNMLSTEPVVDELKHLMIVEEAQNILAAGAEASSVIGSTCREIRAFGVGLVYVTQIPSEFSKNALSNVNTIIAHRLTHPDDRRVIGQMMGVDPKLFDGLEPGFAIVKNKTVVLMRVPLVERPFVAERDLPAPLVTREEVSSDFARRRRVETKASAIAPREWRVFKALAESTAIYPKELREHLGYSQTEINNALGTLIRLGLVGYRPGKLQGAPGIARSIYFLMPDGEEAYRAKEGRYADHKIGASPNHAAFVDHVVAKLGITRKSHRRFDILFDEGLVERAIEVETGSNKNDQVLENLTKSLELQGEGRFIAADKETRNRVLQVASRWCYTQRKPLTVKVALVEQLPEWQIFHFQAASRQGVPSATARTPAVSAPGPSLPEP